MDSIRICLNLRYALNDTHNRMHTYFSTYSLFRYGRLCLSLFQAKVDKEWRKIAAHKQFCLFRRTDRIATVAIFNQAKKPRQISYARLVINSKKPQMTFLFC